MSEFQQMDHKQIKENTVFHLTVFLTQWRDFRINYSCNVINKKGSAIQVHLLTWVKDWSYFWRSWLKGRYSSSALLKSKGYECTCGNSNSQQGSVCVCVCVHAHSIMYWTYFKATLSVFIYREKRQASLLISRELRVSTDLSGKNWD